MVPILPNMWRSTWLVFSQAVTVAVAVLFVLLTLKPGWLPNWSGATRSGGCQRRRRCRAAHRQQRPAP
jgi:hypothetical protein